MIGTAGSASKSVDLTKKFQTPLIKYQKQQTNKKSSCCCLISLLIHRLVQLLLSQSNGARHLLQDYYKLKLSLDPLLANTQLLYKNSYQRPRKHVGTATQPVSTLTISSRNEIFMVYYYRKPGTPILVSNFFSSRPFSFDEKACSRRAHSKYERMGVRRVGTCEHLRTSKASETRPSYPIDMQRTNCKPGKRGLWKTDLRDSSPISIPIIGPCRHMCSQYPDYKNCTCNADKSSSEIPTRWELFNNLATFTAAKPLFKICP